MRRALATLLTVVLCGWGLGQGEPIDIGGEETRNPTGSVVPLAVDAGFQSTTTETFRPVEATRLNQAVDTRLRVQLQAPENAGAFVLVVGPDDYMERREGTGELLFEGLPAGGYLVVASGTDLGLAYGTLLVEPGAEVGAEIELQTLEGGGDARTEEGSGDLEVEIHVFGAQVAVVGDGGYHITTTSDLRFTLDGLAPGRYLVAGTYEGHQAAAMVLEIAAGDSATVDMEIPTLGIPH